MHGSTRYLWNEEAVASKVHYTLHQQGDLMAIYDAKEHQTSELWPFAVLRLGVEFPSLITPAKG